VHIVAYPEDRVPHDLRVQMVSLQRQAWPSAGPLDPAPWHDPDLHPVSMLLLDDSGRVLSALDVLSKDIVHEGETYRASGISAMVTSLEARGRGHGRALALGARELMADRGADLGIFTCDRPLRRFYESAGWEHLVGTVLVGGTPDDPYPSDDLDKVTMATFLSGRATANRARFVGVRIALHPGAVDRLW
jgi:GNAT superfamily N-acetyltransferase